MMTRKDRALKMYTRAIEELHNIMMGHTARTDGPEFVDITPQLSRANAWKDEAEQEGATEEEIDAARSAGITD